MDGNSTINIKIRLSTAPKWLNAGLFNGGIAYIMKKSKTGEMAYCERNARNDEPQYFKNPQPDNNSWFLHLSFKNFKNWN